MAKKNVLVTGSRGFIGKNLVKRMKENSNVIIYEFTRESTLEELESYINKIDFIFHLAGEVRPKSDDVAFKESNTTLTKNLIDLLEENKHYIPIIMASTIHAKFQKNEYGVTKREAEVFVENYAKNHDVCAVNYRLPHVFGEGCKPNYNSVVSTWIYNIIKDLEVVVFDRDIKMEYVYVQDIVDVFIDYLNTSDKCLSIYDSPSITYHTTLGEVIDLLHDFKNKIPSNYNESSFESKLYKVYSDYAKKV